MDLAELGRLPRQGSRWMSLGEAARLLGVHPATLRRWADEGVIRCLRTPGGHRRFLEQDLWIFLNARRQADVTLAPDTLALHLIGQVRRELAAGEVAGESWHIAFDEPGRAARRESKDVVWAGSMAGMRPNAAFR